jgi:hypothetical protein
MIAFWVGVALAAGVHTGIPVHGVAGMGEPSFLTPASGWTAAVDGGWVRVFVGVTEAAGQEWYERQLATMQVAPLALPSFDADVAHGDGETLVAFRDGNVGVVVHADHGAGEIAARLKAAIVDGGPARGAPRLIPTGDRWELDAPGAEHIQATGGSVVPFHPGLYTQAPREVVVWDSYGRAAVVR